VSTGTLPVAVSTQKHDSSASEIAVRPQLTGEETIAKRGICERHKMTKVEGSGCIY